MRPISALSLLLSCLLISVIPSSAEELEGVRAAAAGPCPSVEEAISKMTVPDGYAVRCFASEPMIVNPVAMTWDSRGRLWVVELYEYPSGAAKPNAYAATAADEQFRPVIPQGPDSPRDRVVVLEDTDNDGKADKRTVFAEGLSLATAVLCGNGGVYIGQAPNLFFFRDKDGDDRADEYKTVLTGFGLEDRHELLNSFTWGPDGWMYFTHGVFTHSKVRRPEQKSEEGFTLNAGIFRVKFSTENDGPRADQYEVYADGTSNPWGVDFDARGNAFVEACVIDHFFHMAPGGIYARQGGAPENPYAYELLPSIVGKDHPGHFRAAYAGITIYQGGIYPADTHGHAFFGNIHDNAIHEEAMDPVGATFNARPVRDFLRANNGWFRPVSIQTGPDGFLWVMDWCDKYPCYQNALANPAGVDREKGRIWRVCYTGSPEGAQLAQQSRVEKSLNISDRSLPELVKNLGDSNSWTRRAAKQVLIGKGMEGKREALTDLVKSDAPMAHRMEAMLTFSAILSQDYHVLTWLVEQKAEAPLLAWAARLYGQGGHAGHYWLEQLAGHPDPLVRQAVCVALRQKREVYLTSNEANESRDSAVRINHPTRLETNLLLAGADAGDKTLPFSIWMAIEPALAQNPSQWMPWLAELAPKTKSLSLLLTRKSARRIIDTRKAENVDVLLTFLDQLKGHPDLIEAALEGMLKAQEAGALKPAKTDPTPYFELWQKSSSEKVRSLAGQLATLWGDPNAIAALMGTVLNPDADPGQRLEAIRTVRRLKSDTARAGILKLLGTKTPDSLTNEAIRAAGELGGLDLANQILAAWEGYAPSLKTTAAEIFVSRQDWAERLLDGVEGKWIASGKINPADIPVSVRRRFAMNKDLKDRATQLLGVWNESGDDVKALIAAKRKALTEGEPDMALGKTLFTALCSTCHKFHGGGQEVGPELIGSGRSNLDAILANVIDPNQIIGNGYQNFTITTRDGRTLGGRIVEDTPTQVTLLGLGGSREVVPAADIVKKEDSGLSLMPMGFGALPDDQLRSLIWYLLAPPEEGPLTPQKKEALIKGAEVENPAAPPKAAAAPKVQRIDWESVSLWNPEWKVTAPEFEGTPQKLTEFEGRKNVLQMHPFPDRKSPSFLTRKLTVPAAGRPALHFEAAAKGGSDWDLVVRVDQKEIRRTAVTTANGAWVHQVVDLVPWLGKTVEIQLENHPTGWSWEFSYWSDVKLVP